MRTKRMVSTWFAACRCIATLTASLCDMPASRLTITTSPRAVSLPASSLKRILPDLPDSTLRYSPVHSPTSVLTSAGAPVTGTGGDGFVAHAAVNTTATRHANLMFPPRERTIGRSAVYETGRTDEHASRILLTL